MAFPIRGGTAVLTGAAGGIGAALAVSLAGRGANLALADRNAEGLAEVANATRRQGVKVSEHVLDLSDRAAVDLLPERVLNRHDHITMLINNAGVAMGGTFAELALSDFEWLFDINFWAPIRLTKAFLQPLGREPAAQIVNISSLFGIIAPPGQSAYCAAKFALRGFSETLRHELDGSSVSLLLVHPGGVRTNIANNSKPPPGADPVAVRQFIAEFNKFLRTTPQDAAELIAGAMERRDKRLLIGADARGAERIQRLFPVNYWKYLSRRMKSGASDTE